MCQFVLELRPYLTVQFFLQLATQFYILLGDVKIVNTRFHHSLLLLTYQTSITNLHLLRVELRFSRTEMFT